VPIKFTFDTCGFAIAISAISAIFAIATILISLTLGKLLLKVSKHDYPVTSSPVTSKFVNAPAPLTRLKYVNKTRLWHTY
jgi:hypothetical protein